VSTNDVPIGMIFYGYFPDCDKGAARIGRNVTRMVCKSQKKTKMAIFFERRVAAAFFGGFGLKKCDRERRRLQFLTRDRPLGSVVALTHLIAFARVGRVSPSRHPSVDVSSDLRRSFEQGFFQLPTVKKRTHHVCLRPRQHAGRPRAGAPPG
jgi:hypothetical protein